MNTAAKKRLMITKMIEMREWRTLKKQKLAKTMTTLELKQNRRETTRDWLVRVMSLKIERNRS